MSAFHWILIVLGVFAVFWIVLFRVWWWRDRREDTMDESIPTPSQHLMHPVFGHLVPNEFGELMTFRRFNFLRPFWTKAPNDLGSFSPYERVCIEKWEDYMLPLVSVCRRDGVWSMLRSKGVFEVFLDEAQSNTPTATQEAAYKFFLMNEEKTCANVADALLRYYRVIRKELPDWFDDQFPISPNITELAALADFDVLNVSNRSANGISLLQWSWKPRWDEEHGMGVITFRDQVIMIDQDVGGFLEEPKDFLKDSIWKRDHMTDAERAALDEFLGSAEAKL